MYGSPTEILFASGFMLTEKWGIKLCFKINCIADSSARRMFIFGQKMDSARRGFDIGGRKAFKPEPNQTYPYNQPSHLYGCQLIIVSVIYLNVPSRILTTWFEIVVDHYYQMVAFDYF